MGLWGVEMGGEVMRTQVLDMNGHVDAVCMLGGHPWSFGENVRLLDMGRG